MKRYILILAAILIIIPACTENLNEAPLDTPSSADFYKTKDELLLAINGVYEQTFYFPSTGGESMWAAFDLFTDIAFKRFGSGKAIADGSYSSTSGTVKSVWSHFYNSIARANKLLAGMETAKNNNVPNDFLQQIEGQARFLRAFSYLYLTELYGAVPLLTKVPDLADADIERTPKKKVIDQIISDLDFAAKVLPESWPGSDAGRATKGAALALKARVALYNKRYDLAAQAAQKVMNMGVYSLYPNYKNLFRYKGEHSSESILDISYKKGVHTQGTPRMRASTIDLCCNGYVSDVPSQSLVDSYEATDGKPIDESSVYNPAKPFENRDPRLAESIVLPGSIIYSGGGENIIYESHPDSTETWVVNDEGKRVKRVSNEAVTNPYASYTGYVWRKYVDPKDMPNNVTRSELSFMLIRYAEVLLTYAEARIENNDIDQTVLSAINRVRARAYGVDAEQNSQYPAVTTTNQSELRRIVRRERKVEFASEGLRLFDIKRWRIADAVMNGELLGRPKGAYSTVSTPKIDDQTGDVKYENEVNLYENIEPRTFDPDKNYLWPIPQDEMNTNEKIKQNPGY